MNSVNKTLYIPLYGKAYVSRKGIILDDKKAEQIWATEGFPLKGKSKSKWLAYYMGMRAATLDRWLRQQMAADDGAVVVHIGCGLDSRVLRVGLGDHKWYDVDFADVIAERKRYYQESDSYRMIAGDVRNSAWISEIPEAKSAIVVMEGVSMYLTRGELQKLFGDLDGNFEKISLLMDCYSELAAKMSRYKNPINDVGVTEVFGLDQPALAENGAVVYVKEHPMTPRDMIDTLSGAERSIFRKLYAGGLSKKLYRLYEYEKRNNEE